MPASSDHPESCPPARAVTRARGADGPWGCGSCVARARTLERGSGVTATPCSRSPSLGGALIPRGRRPLPQRPTKPFVTNRRRGRVLRVRWLVSVTRLRRGSLVAEPPSAGRLPGAVLQSSPSTSENGEVYTTLGKPPDTELSSERRENQTVFPVAPTYTPRSLASPSTRRSPRPFGASGSSARTTGNSVSCP